MTPAVRARGWGFRYAGRRAWAIRGLDLEVAPGERVLLLGASGEGKSTLLKALAGVLGGDDAGEQEGLLEVGGRAPDAARGAAGLVLQDPETQVVLPRVADDVAFGAENLGVPADRVATRVRRALELVGLDVPGDRSTSALSGGQKQRLALAGVLAMRPGLLLLDEPTANLDPAGARSVRDAVVAAAAATGSTLVVVEHRVAIWQHAVDRVVVVGREGVVAAGPVQRVLDARGAELAAAGVWVPGRSPAPPRLPAGSEALLSTEALVVGRDAPVRALPDLALRAGGALLLAGGNGCGKTTALLTLGGLLAPRSGRVVAAPALRRGLPDAPLHWRSRDLPSRIGSVLQSPQHQFVTRSVQQEIRLGATDAAAADAVLERVGLAALARANPFTLSGGQQRRLTVAAALAARPAVLLLDEPTFGQDAATWAVLVDLVAEALADGVAVAAATHDELLLSAADRVLPLEPAAVPA